MKRKDFGSPVTLPQSHQSPNSESNTVVHDSSPEERRVNADSKDDKTTDQAGKEKNELSNSISPKIEMGVPQPRDVVINLRQMLLIKWACNMCNQRFRSKIALKKHKFEQHSY